MNLTPPQKKKKKLFQTQTQPKSPQNRTPDKKLFLSKALPSPSSSSLTISFNATPSSFLSFSIRSTLKLPLCFMCSSVFYFFVSSLPQVYAGAALHYNQGVQMNPLTSKYIYIYIYICKKCFWLV